ncbi:DUF362 domain-containing protein [Candidatus Woesearchaeota archaeon]|nr:DUF362 domain-containing protein [Candidatus Woesearchaeota archaeon]
MADVAVVDGVVRYDNIFRSLKLVKDGVAGRLSGSSHIVIKPDILHVDGCSGVASVDAVKAVLDFVEEFTNKKVVIAEGAFVEEDVFYRHGFHELLEDYSVRFVNLDYDDSVPVRLGSFSVGVSKVLLESDFRVSLAVFGSERRHFVGSVSNMVLGAVSGRDKASFYRGRFFGRNVAELSRLLKPHLSVFDCFDAVMSEKKSSFAVAGVDAVSVDRVAAKSLRKPVPSYLNYLPKQRVTVVRA